VECKMDFRAGVGSLECRLCGASYQMPIHHLHEPIDVFSEWLDDCETAQQGRNPNQEEDEEEEAEEDDNLGEASGLGQQVRKEPAQPAAATQQRQSYTDLGLDDSDDESDDE
jgi:Transcription elongation factor Elf1 like